MNKLEKITVAVCILQITTLIAATTDSTLRIINFLKKKKNNEK